MSSARALALLALVAAAVLLPVWPARAAVFTVDTTADDASLSACDDGTANDCSLRGAVARANALTESSTINVPAGTYVLTQGGSCFFRDPLSGSEFFSTVSLCVSCNVKLVGEGAASTVIDANQPPGITGLVAPVMFVSSGVSVELRGLTLRRGNFSVGSLFGHGGGVRTAATLLLADSVVSDNTTLGPGGGIYNTGTLTVLRTLITRNSSQGPGGGIFNGVGGVVLADSIVSDNVSGASGGGISNFSGTVTITGTTISGNTAQGAGGGAANGNFNTMSLANSTVSGNRAAIGGGLFNDQVGNLMSLSNVTVTNNTAQAFADPSSGLGGGLFNDDSGIVTLQNTIIAGNFAPATGNCGIGFCNPPGIDCFAFAGHGGALQSRGYNLIQDTGSCAITGDLTGNLIGVDPKLGSLTDQSGPTPTHPLGVNSPAIDAGNPAAPGSGGTACTAVDQRGIARPQASRCDIGAFEGNGGFAVTKILPGTGGNTGSIAAVVNGNGFMAGASLALRRSGEPDIVATGITAHGISVLAGSLDLTGRSTGPWDVVVTNPDGTSATIAGGFTIADGRAPQVWADIVGLSTIKVGFPVVFTIFYGNRGNVDAFAVPLDLGISNNVASGLAFPITPPPAQTGQVPTDWNRVSIHTEPDANDLTFVSLLLPIVPAGFTGVLRFTITAPVALADNATVQIKAGIGTPYFQPELSPRIVARFIDDARTNAAANFGVTVPDSLVPELTQYLTAQLQQEVAHGRMTWDDSAGTTPEVYSVFHLVFDLTEFAAARAQTSTP